MAYTDKDYFLTKINEDELEKLTGVDVNNMIMGEIITPLLNQSTYTLLYSFVAKSTRVFLNGVRLKPGDDYNEILPDQIQFLIDVFGDGDILIDYEEDEDGKNLASAIAAADSLIDSYLSSKTATPLDEPPEIIKQLSYDIAIFYLHDRIQYNDIPERVKDKYDAALNFLKDIASGKAALPSIDDDDIEDSVQYDVNPWVFDRSSI